MSNYKQPRYFLDLELDSRCQAHDICEISFIDEDLMSSLKN